MVDGVQSLSAIQIQTAKRTTMNSNNNNTNNPRRFVYNTGSKSTSITSDPLYSWSTRNASRINPSGPGGSGSMAKNDQDFELCLEFDDVDDITSTMSEADLERLELEATKKLGLTQESGNAGGKKVESKTVVPMVVETNSNRKANFTPSRKKSPHKAPGSNSSDASQSGWAKPAPSNAQLQQMAAQLQEYKSKVQQLEGTLYEKDGEVKILRSSLVKNRQENAEKSERIFQLQNKQTVEQNKREASLVKEVTSLKTRLSFQEQDLIEQSKRIQSQAKAFSVTSSVKRKAETLAPSTSFDLDNSFIVTQSSSSKKMPRIAERIHLVKPEPIPGGSTSKKPTVKTDELHRNPPSQSGGFMQHSESKEFLLVKNLLLSHSSREVDSNPANTMGLLNLLKYPLKHLPEVLKAHSVNTCMQESSQFPLWQSQKLNVGPIGENSVDEVLDLESGKYTLVTQGIFMLLGLHERARSKAVSNSYEKVRPSLGVMHILIFLELYISSYLLTKQDEANTADDTDSATVLLQNENERQNSDDLEMVIYTLKILKLLIYSAPSLVKCIINRTSPSVFQNDNDVVIIDDDDLEEMHEETKNDAAASMAGPSTEYTRIPGSSNCYTQVPPEEWKIDVEEDEASDEGAMGSFLSLLLPNLEKLVIPHLQDESLTVCYTALEVLIAMTSICEKTENERIFSLLKRGCLDTLLAKNSGSTTIHYAMSLLRNLLPCKDIHSMLCSQSDHCILLKIYQCACEEDEEDSADALWGHFLLEVVEFIKSVAFSHSDSIQFLLETDCQCSQEIIRCLVLILHDKVNFLLDLDPSVVTTDESLTMLRIGMTLLVVLCTHNSYSADHKLDVEHYYIELIYKVMILYQNIKHIIPDLEALGVQDLLDMEQIDELEWSLVSDNEDDEFMETDG